MVDEKCSNCMLQRRGDCFGEEKICESYKPIPNVGEKEINNWPVIMRSNKHSNHLEWKKEQENRENTLSETEKPRKTSQEKKKSFNYEEAKNYDDLECDNITYKQLDFNVNNISDFYKEAIILWFYIDYRIQGKYACKYLLEYKGNFRGGRTSKYDELYKTLYKGVVEAVKRIKEAKKYDLVIVFPSKVASDIKRYKDILFVIKEKAKKCVIYTSTTKDTTVSLYINKYCN